MDEPPNWHALSTGDVLAKIDSNGSSGLSDKAVEDRLERFGPNALPAEHGPGMLRRFLAQFHNILIYILLIAALVTALLQHFVDSAVILGVVIINAIVGFIQEGKAQDALASIRKMLSLEATVIRNGSETTIPAEQLVPGDLVLLASGNRVPADIRLLDTQELHVQEAVLTGESSPVEKAVEATPEEAGIGDRRSMAYSGTLVVEGRARGVVVGTGQNTEIGRISKLVSEVEELTTPLLRQIARFGWWLSGVILGITVLVFGFGFFFRDYTFDELFLAAVGIAVGAIPEGLPPMMTVALAIGVRRMAKRNAIIRKLPAVETLGSVTIICTDKTGTLTRNEMTVRTVVTGENTFTVTGTGYAPNGEIRIAESSSSATENPVLHELLEAGILCNDSRIEEDGRGEWQLRGTPTEGALLTLARKAGLDPDRLNKDCPRTDQVPFESRYKYMATLHEARDVIYVKGAPDQLLDRCDRQQNANGTAELDRAYWKDQFTSIATEGQRLLGLAKKPAPEGASRITHDDLRNGLTLLGIVGILDPPRDEAITAIGSCHAAGIRVKMITGDYPATASSIARQMKIGDGKNVVTGKEIETATEEHLFDLADRNDVFARTSPEHKLKIVTALQKRGHVVAMTGDGVNDAPALKRADVGIAMGIKGSEASKEASKVVLADDNFVSIERAIEEGRTVYANLRKTLLFLLPTNGAQAGIITLAILMGWMLPITPVQILWVNMVAAATLALALAFEPPEEAFMQMPPRHPAEPILTGYLTFRILYVSLLLLAVTLGIFFYARATAAVDLARTAAVNALLASTAFYLFSSRSTDKTVFSKSGFRGNPKIWIGIGTLLCLQAIFTYFPPAQTVFGTAGLPPRMLVLILAAGFGILLIVELEKGFARRFRPKRRDST